MLRGKLRMRSPQANPRVLCAYDKFKETLTAKSACEITSSTLQTLLPKLTCESLPMSDGGDGFLNTLMKPLNLQLKSVTVSDPLDRPITAEYGFDLKEKVAVVEMASASGLDKMPKDKRNPLNTTSKGTGQLIQAAYNDGFRRIILGVGGTATNDAGLGALSALGLKITVKDPQTGQVFEPPTFYGYHLTMIEKIEMKEPILPDAVIEIATDVDSPFVGDGSNGPRGAVYAFSGQKGASEEDKVILEDGMKRAARLLRNVKNIDVSKMEGAGAAGGLPGGFSAILPVKLRKGFDLISDLFHLEDRIKQSDLVITGEGAYDSTSLSGKVPYQVIQMCKKHGVPVVVICGVMKDVQDDISVPIYQLVSLYPVEEAMRDAPKCLKGLILKFAPQFPVVSDLLNENSKL